MKAMTLDQIGATRKVADMPSAKIIEALATSSHCMEHFYLTGFEGLCLALSHEELTRSVISSVVPMNGEMLVVGNAEACALWRKTCHELKIRMSAIDASEEDLGCAIETVLKVNPSITNIMTSTTCGVERLNTIGKVAKAHRLSFVVDNTDDILTMEDVRSAGVDFAIAADSGEPLSVIVARRSRLVMTEGNARMSEHDIYALWQGTLSSRNSTWIPMA